MKARIARDLRKSARLFVDLVWPEIGPLIGGGDYISLESEESLGLRLLLDAVGGIDGFQVCLEDKTVRGIATRVQCVKEPYDTFTIRYARANGADTEWIKRLRALSSDFASWTVPEITIQAYVDKRSNELISAAAVPTRALYDYALKWLERNARNRLFTWQNWHDKNQFIVIPWSGLHDENVPLVRWPDA